MLNIVNVTAPFFALVACGFLAARFRLLPDNAVPALNTYVLYFALPCMLFRFTLATPFEQIFNPQVFLAYAATGNQDFAVREQGSCVRAPCGVQISGDSELTR